MAADERLHVLLGRCAAPHARHKQLQGDAVRLLGVLEAIHQAVDEVPGLLRGCRITLAPRQEAQRQVGLEALTPPPPPQPPKGPCCSSGQRGSNAMPIARRYQARQFLQDGRLIHEQVERMAIAELRGGPKAAANSCHAKWGTDTDGKLYNVRLQLRGKVQDPSRHVSLQGQCSMT